VAGYTKMVYPETVTHPSINWARRRVTTLIETNAPPLSQATTACLHTVCCTHGSCTELKGHCLFVLVSGYVCKIKLHTQLSSPR